MLQFRKMVNVGTPQALPCEAPFTVLENTSHRQPFKHGRTLETTGGTPRRGGIGKAEFVA